MADYSLLFVGVIAFCAGVAIGALFGWGHGYSSGRQEERVCWLGEIAQGNVSQMLLPKRWRNK